MIISIRQQGLSPRVRGYSDRGIFHVSLTRVVPACAGVFPRRLPCQPLSTRSTRLCGGIPRELDRALEILKLSPRVRGYSLSTPSRGVSKDVVPAHAGVFPKLRQLTVDADRCPRTRGGIPYQQQLARSHPGLSPYPRGYAGSLSRMIWVASGNPVYAGVYQLKITTQPHEYGKKRSTTNHPKPARQSSSGGLFV